MSAAPRLSEALAGRTFLHPAWDYLLIGGGLSLITTALVVWTSAGAGLVGATVLPYFVLVSNAAHFAASTVRLYTKPDSRETWPFLTMGFPMLALAVLTLCLLLAERLGPHLQSLYLTWSPYHYAAQAYGLAVMYSQRSGCRLDAKDKRWLYWIALLPFFYNFLTAPGVGLRWLVPGEVLTRPWVATATLGAHYVLLGLAFATPLLLFARIWRSKGRPMPLISLLTVLTNGVWFFVLAPLDAFVYATVFHGIQYLAIVMVFHVKDQVAREGNRHGSLYHALAFYGASLLLGYGLFNCLPLAYTLAGFGEVESILLVVAAINIHHFIVDAFIWRLRRDERNRRVVESGLPVPA